MHVQVNIRRVVLTAVLLVGFAPGNVRPQATGGQGKGDSPAAWTERIQTAVKRENLENAIYYYRSLVNVLGSEDAEPLSEVAGLSLRMAMRREGRWVRISSAEALARRGDGEALQVLRESASSLSTDPSLRLRCLVLLGELGDRASIPMLQELVFDPERTVLERLSAADALLRMGDLTGTVELVRTLEGGKPTERVRAAEIAGDRRLSVRASLRKTAAEAEGPLRLRALRALALLGEADALETLRAEFGDPGRALPRWTPPAPEGGGDATPKPELDEREIARLYDVGSVLLEAGDTSPVDWLAALAGEPHAPLGRGAAAIQVAAVDRERGIGLLRQVMKDGMVLDRVRAAAELARLGEPEGVADTFAQAYRSTRDRGEDGLRMRVLLSLEEVRVDGVAAVLIEALDDPSPIHRIVAARGLVERGEPAGLRPLRRLLESADRADAVKAAEALLGDWKPASPAGENPAPAEPPADRGGSPATS